MIVRGFAGRVATDLSVLRRGDRWWICLAALPALALFAWRARDAVLGAAPVDGVAWVLGAIGYAGFGSLSVVLCLVDVRTRRLPNRLLGITAVWVLGWLVSAALLAGDGSRIGWAFALAALGVVIFSLLWLRFGHSFGGGDVKLAPICMFAVAWVDPAAAGPVFLLACAAVTIPVFIVSLRRREAELPFGPSLIAAAWLALAFPSNWVFGL